MVTCPLTVIVVAMTGSMRNTEGASVLPETVSRLREGLAGGAVDTAGVSYATAINAR